LKELADGSEGREWKVITPLFFIQFGMSYSVDKTPLDFVYRWMMREKSGLAPIRCGEFKARKKLIFE
jgi:hypothetical protein